MSKGFDDSLGTILDSNVGDELLFMEGLEFLSPPLAASLKSLNDNGISKSVFGWVANVVCLNGQEFILIVLATISLI